MKLSNANKVRERYVAALYEALKDEDLGMITSNSFNFPTVEDGEEGWVEIVVKVVKDDEGYEKREQYADKVRERAERAKENAEKKAKKIARDKAYREAQKKKKEASSL